MLTKNPNGRAGSPGDKHIGSRVRMRRIMLGKSQTWLGNQIGVTFQQVQKYELGVNRIGGGRLQQISNALEVTPSFFFESMPTARGTSQGAVRPDFVNHVLATKDGLALVRGFSHLAPKLKSIVVDLVENLQAV